MKKCPHCNGIFSDDFEKCPQCDIVLSNYTSDDKEKDDNEIEKEKIRKLITIGALVAAFILGIGFKSIIGVKRTDYVNLKIKNEELQKQYDELSTAKDGLQKEYDTYKVGTVANSTSTMHKIHSKSFEMSDFSTDHMNEETIEFMGKNIEFLENLRVKYNDTKDKTLWYSIIKLLPES